MENLILNSLEMETDKEQVKDVAGDKLRTIETFTRIKIILVDFLRGYPVHKYYGIFESYSEPHIATQIINELHTDGIVKLWNLKVKDKQGKEVDVLGYSLTGEGAQLATSLSINFRIRKLTAIATILAGMAVLVGLIQYVLSYAQYPLF